MKNNTILFFCITFIFFAFFNLNSQVADLVWNTFLGNTDNDSSISITTDNAGNIYITGTSGSDWGAPIRSYSGGDDIFVIKLSPSGQFIWHTFLGSSSDDWGGASTVDRSGNIYVNGASYNTWGQPLNPHTNSYMDIMIAKLSPDGTLVWHTFYGGYYYDSACHIVSDNVGNTYSTGYSYSSWGLPVRAFTSLYDAFVLKLDTSGNLIWNTFLGGNDWDWGEGIAIDNSNNILISGGSDDTWGNPVSEHSDFTYDDFFVAKLNSNGELIWNTFLGAVNTNDVAGRLVVDRSENIYVTGGSRASWGAPLIPYSARSDITVFKLGSDGDLLWNTFFGWNYDEEGYGITIDSENNIYVTGSGESDWASPINPHNREIDIAIVKIRPNGSLIWNTFLGGIGSELGKDIVLDRSGNIYISGLSYAPWSSPIRSYSGNQDAFAAKISQTYEYKIRSVVKGTGGCVEKELQYIPEGEDCTINIIPDAECEIATITDNGIEIPVSNPCIICNVQEDHNVEISFQLKTYPPQLLLSGSRKTESSWIIEKDYIELDISIIKNERPMDVSEIILYKSTSEIWVEAAKYNGPGTYDHSEKFISKDTKIKFKLTAFAPDGSIASESKILSL